jgi:hypothetical protein
MFIPFYEKHFHINTPYYGAWTRYGWKKDDWGLGLRKERIDKLAKSGATIYVSYLKSDQLYTIKAELVKTYPIDEIGWAKVKVYVIPRSALNYCEQSAEEIKSREMYRAGVFG